VGLLAVTSPDRLFAGHAHAERMAAAGNRTPSHVETLLSDVPRHCAIVTVVDAHPATLGWLGGIIGHRTVALGVDSFGQSGAIGDLYAHYGIDVNGILAAAERATAGRPVRHRKMFVA
jgi:pyruvate dehydrogenase E1 component